MCIPLSDICQCVAVCYSVLQCVAVYVQIYREKMCVSMSDVCQCVAVCCSVLQCMYRSDV